MHAQPFRVKEQEVIRCSRFVRTSPEAAQPDKAISQGKNSSFHLTAHHRKAKARLAGGKRSNRGP